MNKYLHILPLFLSIFILSTSCKKFIQVGPPKTGLTDKSIYESTATVRAVINGIYADMQGGSSFASGGDESITQVCGLSSDELINYATSSDYTAIYQNAISPTNVEPSHSTWNNPYYYIYECNSLIEGIPVSTTISETDKRSLISEAKFIRAFCYFYLANLYGDVPLHLTSDYRSNSNVAKTLQKDVYTQIVNDLKDAEAGMLPPGAGDTRIIPNADVASALLARVYLYTGQNQGALSECNKIIANTGRYQILPDLNEVFLQESKEAIWQLQPVIPGSGTNEGAHFILTDAPIDVSLSDGLVASFEQGDRRREDWVGEITVNEITYYFPYKYKIQSEPTPTEYSMVIRLAEVYLIRAEAELAIGDISAAAADVNAIRSRAGLPNTSATDQESLKLAIEHERRVELFTEWGHRWLDLKRTGRATTVLSPIKTSWKETAIYYPIPQAEINTNKKIIQNSGY